MSDDLILGMAVVATLVFLSLMWMQTK